MLIPMEVVAAEQYVFSKAILLSGNAIGIVRRVGMGNPGLGGMIYVPSIAKLPC